MKHLSIIRLFLFIMVGLVLSRAAHAHDFYVGGIYYSISYGTEKNVYVTYAGSSYSAYSNEYSGSVTIPSTVYYNGTTYNVTSIGRDAFKDCTGLVSITIPASITDVYWPFAGCTGLKTVILTDSDSPNYTTFHTLLPDERDGDGDYDLSYEKAVFEDCNIQNFYIGHPFKSLRYYYYWYYGTNLSTCIGTLFSKNRSINRVEYGPKLTKPISKCCFDGKEEGYFGTSGSIENLYIPSIDFWCNLHNDYNGYNPMNISKNLYVNDLKTQDIVISKSVTTLGNKLFAGASFIQSVTLPVYLTSIGDYCFYECKNLKTVNNNSSLVLERGSYTNGYVAYYAQVVLDSGDVLEGDFVWNTSNGHVLKSYTSNSEAITLPANHKGYSYSIGAKAFKGLTFLTSLDMSNADVISIGESACKGCSGLTSVRLPANSLQSIGASAFESCTNITNIAIPASVASLGSSVFSGCTALTSATLGRGITNIPDYAFQGCKLLGTITIPTNTKSIGNYAFKNTGITSCSIPSSVTNLGSNVFEGCKRLTSVLLSNEIEEIPESTFKECNVLASISIPSTVKRIGSYAFYSTAISSVSIPSCVTFVGNSAFENCKKLTTATILSNISALPSSVFRGCSSLVNVSLPNTITSMGEYAFYNCTELKTVNIPNMVSVIPTYCFYGCESLQNIVLPDFITTISGYAFYGCSYLNSIILPENLNAIGSNAFYNCKKLKIIQNKSSLTIKKGNSDNGYVAYYASAINPISVGDFMFDENDELVEYTGTSQDIVLPDSYKNNSYGIGRYGLSSINAKNIILSEGVKYISDYAFYGCDSLENITIPQNVTSISGNYTFANCPKLKTIYYDAVHPTITATNGLTNSGNKLEIIVGNNVKYIPSLFLSNNIYKVDFKNSLLDNLSCANLSSSIREMVLGNSMNTIPGDFKKFNNLIDLTIPQSITNIAAGAFSGCTSLDTIRVVDLDSWLSMKLGDSSSNPLNYAHNIYVGGELLENLVIPSTMKTISSKWFKNLTCIKSIQWGDNLTTIESGAFSGVNNVKTIICKTVLPPSCSLSEFQSVWRSCTLYVPQENYDKYCRIQPWSQFLNIEKLATAIDDNETDGGYALSIHGKNVAKGSEFVFPIALTNASNITALQFDLVMPAGISVATDANGNKITWSERTTSERHSISSAKQADGSIRIAGLSMAKSPFLGNSGDLMFVTLRADEGMSTGVYCIELKNIILSTLENKKIVCEGKKINIIVDDYIKGDADSDGSVTINDVVTIVSYILEEEPTPFTFVASDIDDDGNITVNDAVCVVNMIIGTIPGQIANAKAQKEPETMVAFSMQPISIMQGETKDVYLSLTNDVDVTAFQLDMKLPEGVTLIGVEKMDNRLTYSHIVQSRTINDTVNRLVVLSLDNSAISNTQGPIVRIKIKAKEDMQNGIFECNMQNAHISTSEAQLVNAKPFTVNLYVGNATDIESVNVSAVKNKAYDVSGQSVNFANHRGITILNGIKILKK